jgi:glycosyltransferase involved in cell wall biosynthesis
VAPNAFDVAKVQGRGRSPELARRLGLEGCAVVGFAGWFSAWDRLDLLVSIFAELLPRHPQARLLLIGDGAVAPELKRQAEALGIADHVVFTGAVARAEVYDHIALLDVAVLPHSNDFGSPVVMFEFMGLKVPLVAPRLDPILDVQRDGETALLFDPLDARQCREVIERLLGSAHLRAALAEAAHALLVREHSWRRNAQRILASAGLG